MSRVAITPSSVDSSGVLVTAPATTMATGANNGISFNNAVGKTALIVKGHATNPAVLTIKSQVSLDGNAVPDKTVNIAAASYRILNFPATPYNDANGNVNVDTDVAVTVQALYLTN